MDFLRENFYMVTVVGLFALGVLIALFLEVMFVAYDIIFRRKDEKDEKEILQHK